MDIVKPMLLTGIFLDESIFMIKWKKIKLHENTKTQAVKLVRLAETSFDNISNYLVRGFKNVYSEDF